MDLIKTKSWDTALLRANFPSSFNSEGITDILEISFPSVKFEYKVVDVENKDWVTAVQETWLPQEIGNLTVRFPWHIENTPEIKNEYQQYLTLEGGAAFGTGDHPTTRLCCHWLEKELLPHHKNNNKADNSRNKVDISVLDYGCGSAILGLAALRFGARRATGVDIDKDAIISASNNCIMNNMNMDFYLADDDEGQSDEERSVVNNILKGYQLTNFIPVKELEKEGEHFDLLVANILAPILIHLAPVLASHLKVGGKIALSGLLARQAEVVIERYKEFFDDLLVEESEDDWVLITGVKR